MASPNFTPTCNHDHCPCGPVDEHDIELQVGRPSPTRSSALKRFGLALLAGLVFIAILDLIGSAVLCRHHHHHWRHWHGYAVSNSDLELVPGTKGPLDQLDAGGPIWQSANTTFPLDLTKQLWLDIKTGHTSIVVSQISTTAGIEGQEKGSNDEMKGSITLESTWSERRDTTSLVQGSLSTRLDVKGHPSTVHKIYINLPTSSTYIPFLSIKAPQLDLSIRPSGQKTVFGEAYLNAPQIVNLPNSMIAHNLAIIGDTGVIKGLYNISGHLDIQLDEGEISASVNLINSHLLSGQSGEKFRQPARVNVKVDIGDIDLSILSIDKGLESDVKAEARMGNVNISHAPSFEGRVKGNTEVGEIGVELAQGKELCCEAEEDGEVFAWVWITDEVDSEGRDTSREDVGIESSTSPGNEAIPPCFPPNWFRHPPPCVPPQCIDGMATASTSTVLTTLASMSTLTASSPPICVPPHCYPHSSGEGQYVANLEQDLIQPPITATSPPICVPPHCHPHSPPGHEHHHEYEDEHEHKKNDQRILSPPIFVSPHYKTHPVVDSAGTLSPTKRPVTCLPPFCHPKPEVATSTTTATRPHETDPDPICMPPYCVPFKPLPPAVPTTSPSMAAELNRGYDVHGCTRCGNGYPGRRGKDKVEAMVEYGSLLISV